MKKTAVLVIMVMLMVVLAGCAKNNNEAKVEEQPKDSASTETTKKEEPAPPAKDPVTIKFMNYTASGGQEETIAEMIKLFQAANPHITVDLQILAYGDYFTKLNTVIGGGDAAPDVFEVGYEGFASYASKGVLLDLSPFIASDTSFNAGVYKKLAYDAFNYKGKQYGVSESFSDVLLFYNKDLFDSKGVAYPQPSWTWQDELAAAQKLTDAKNGVWGTFAPIQFWEFYKTIAQNGGGIWSADNKPTVNSKENVEALNWMLDKANKHKVSPALNDDTFNQPDADLNAFIAGKIGMLRAGVWNLGRFKENVKFNWDIALEPGNTQKGHHFFADGLVASSGSKHGEAVWEFIKFISSDPAAVSLRISKGWSVPAVADDNVLAAYYAQTPPASKKVVTDALDSLVLPPVGPIPDRWNDLTGAVGEELEKAKLGKIDAQTALDNAQKKVEALLK
jgi:multiple sugar transport system substrate-binding protein